MKPGKLVRIYFENPAISVLHNTHALVIKKVGTICSSIHPHLDETVYQVYSLETQDFRTYAENNLKEPI